ncbi:MAG TPA: translation initiation factor [Candidatus Dormibacteraeota bacterium]|jgi:translation initiation factor 1|nr:translation initiation factor [Candidatus Dormibacteraeota bacterium]
MSEELTFEDILKHIDRESEHFVIRHETHHHSGREVTIVEPHSLSNDETSLKDLARKLKEKLGTGGGVENGRIVLHGNLRSQAMSELVKLGFKDENIEMI